MKNFTKWVHFKLSLTLCCRGRWDIRRGGLFAEAGVPTRHRQFEMHPTKYTFLKRFILVFIVLEICYSSNTKTANSQIYKAIEYPIAIDADTSDWQGILFETINKKTHLWVGQGMSVENWEGLNATDGCVFGRYFFYGFTERMHLVPRLKETGMLSSPHCWDNRLKTNYTAHLSAGLGNVCTI